MLYLCLMKTQAPAQTFAVQQERFLSETRTAVFLYVLQDGEVYAMNSFPHLHKQGFLLNAAEIQTFHLHEFAEVLLLVKGHLLHEVNGSHHILPPGSLVFVRPYDLHRLLPLNSERAVFASLILASTVIRELMDYLCAPSILNRFNTAPEALCFYLSPDEARALMLQMERISNEQAVAPETSTLLSRALAAQLFASYLLCPEQPAQEAPPPPAWLARLREEAESWDDMKNAPHRLHQRSKCHPSHLCKSFKRYFGETPTSFLNRLRLRRAVRLLKEPDAKITSVATELGFESLSHFHRLFKRHYGLTPAQYRRDQTVPG
jgi:AraC family cel operon transcriptional repressor